MFTCAKSRTNFRYFNIMNNDFGKESDGLPMQTVVICFSLQVSTMLSQHIRRLHLNDLPSQFGHQFEVVQ